MPINTNNFGLELDAEVRRAVGRGLCLSRYGKGAEAGNTQLLLTIYTPENE
jgi:hypothetical protein